MAGNDRPTSPDDMAQAIDSLLKHNLATKTTVDVGGSVTETGADPDDDFSNPMDDYGQLIDGDEGGAPAKVPAGTLGQVLTMATVAGHLRPRFAAAAAVASGQYRQYVVAWTGTAIDFVWDASGDPVVALHDLE